MKNLTAVIDQVKAKFAGVYVDIEKHDIIGGEYEVSCYGVHENLSNEVLSFIFDLNDELYPNNEIELIPILYTQMETSEHFPQIALKLLLEMIPESNSQYQGIPVAYSQIHSVPIEYSTPRFLDVIEQNTQVQAQAEWKKPVQSESIETAYGLAA